MLSAFHQSLEHLRRLRVTMPTGDLRSHLSELCLRAPSCAQLGISHLCCGGQVSVATPLCTRTHSTRSLTSLCRSCLWYGLQMLPSWFCSPRFTCCVCNRREKAFLLLESAQKPHSVLRVWPMGPAMFESPSEYRHPKIRRKTDSTA